MNLLLLLLVRVLTFLGSPCPASRGAALFPGRGSVGSGEGSMEVSRAERVNDEDKLRLHVSRGAQSSDPESLSSSTARPWQGEDQQPPGMFLPLSHSAFLHWGLWVSPCGHPGTKLCSWGACCYASRVSGPPDQGRQGWGWIKRGQAGRLAPLEGRVAARIATATERPSHISYVDSGSSGLCRQHLTLCRNSPG